MSRTQNQTVPALELFVQVSSPTESCWGLQEPYFAQWDFISNHIEPIYWLNKIHTYGYIHIVLPLNSKLLSHPLPLPGSWFSETWFKLNFVQSERWNEMERSFRRDQCWSWLKGLCQSAQETLPWLYRKKEPDGKTEKKTGEETTQGKLSLARPSDMTCVVNRPNRTCKQW
jgi:hypothetical protein